MAHVFAPCYFALGKGSGVERQVTGANTLGLHGNAILSRYPLRDIRLIPLENGVDKMAHREQRIGCQQAVAARIEFPNLALTAASVHLDAQSTAAPPAGADAGRARRASAQRTGHPGRRLEHQHL